VKSIPYFSREFHMFDSYQLGRDPLPVYQAARLLINIQLGTGEFPQQVIKIYWFIHMVLLRSISER
jgi:hypothetical protein